MASHARAQWMVLVRRLGMAAGGFIVWVVGFFWTLSVGYFAFPVMFAGCLMFSYAVVGRGHNASAVGLAAILMALLIR